MFVTIQFLFYYFIQFTAGMDEYITRIFFSGRCPVKHLTSVFPYLSTSGLQRLRHAQLTCARPSLCIECSRDPLLITSARRSIDTASAAACMQRLNDKSKSHHDSADICRRDDKPPGAVLECFAVAAILPPPLPHPGHCALKPRCSAASQPAG